MARLPDIEDVVEWLRVRKLRFINARRLAKAFKISSKSAGYILKKLCELGYVSIHKKRRGRFTIYKVSDVILKS